MTQNLCGCTRLHMQHFRKRVSIPGTDETVWSRKTEKKVPCVVTQINKTLKVPSVEIQFTHQGGGTESGNIEASPLKAQPPQARADQTLYQCCKSIPESLSETFLSAPTVAHPPNAVVMNAEVAGGSVFEQREARALIGNSH